MENTSIKNAFYKVKDDILNLQYELDSLKSELSDIRNLLESLHDSIVSIKYERNYEKDHPTDINKNPTLDRYPTDKPTVPQEIKGLKDPNILFSTGNKGVPTDRQTNQQTVQQTENEFFKPYKPEKYLSTNSNNAPTIEEDILKANYILDSLDNLKKEIRQKFKNLTSQEMIVFSAIYELEEKDPPKCSYLIIASLLQLSESSIRDYVGKMIKKGIPIKKHKINNKKVLLSISPELKKIAKLSTIIQLREL
ncbi:MAG: hypothetical protein Q8N99_07040 [Nanoarchaeota archaeon]|nr:hypothetical protein [Nanoarchaeota archaeon]